MVIKWHGKIDRNRITFWLRGSQNCRFVPFGNKHYGVPLLCCDAEFSENKNGRTEFHSMNVVHVKRQPKHFGLNQHTSRKTKCVCTIWRMLHFLRMLLLFIDMNVFGVARGVFCFCRYCCYSRPSFWLSIVLAVLFRSSQQWAEWHQKVLFTLNSVTLSTPRRRHRHHHRQQTTHRNVLQTYTHTRACTRFHSDRCGFPYTKFSAFTTMSTLHRIVYKYYVARASATYTVHSTSISLALSHTYAHNRITTFANLSTMYFRIGKIG